MSDNPPERASRRLPLCHIATLMLLILASPVAIAGTFNLLPATGFERQTGAPITESVTFPALDPGADYTLNVFNGGLEDHELTGELVSSSIITLNGVEIFGPNEFNKNTLSLSKAVNLQNENELTVQLRGKPGGVITLTVTGEDAVPPQISAFLSGPPNGAGWHNADVTVSFQCSDATSGIFSCTQPVTVASEGASQTVTGTAIDNAGNEATTSVEINLDKTPPAVQFVSPLPSEIIISRRPSISLSASDNIGFEESSLSVLLNGAPFGGNCNIDNGVVTCQPNSDLPAGTIILEASLSDFAGNTGSDQISFQIELDSDGDGVNDDIDQCPDTPSGLNVDSSGCPVVLSDDSDEDFISDINDNCPSIFNPDQADADADGIGDACGLVGGISISSPIDGETIGTSTTSVFGTLSGPEGSEVFVNVSEACVHENQFAINNVPVNTGENILAARLVPQLGIGPVHEITINRSGTSLFSVELNSNCEATPHEALFLVKDLDPGILQISVDFDGDGVPDAISADLSQLEFAHTYNNPGIFQATISGFDGNGAQFDQTLTLILQDGAIIEAEIQTAWDKIVNGFLDNDANQVMQQMTLAAQEKYGKVFDVLQDELPAIINSFSDLQPVDINPDYAEFAVNRIIDGENRLFLIYFVKDGNDNWKLDSM